MKKDVVLTPCQSKNLIAKAFFQSKYFSDCVKNKGRVIINRGTTNSYLVEEFTKKKIDKKRFTSGVVMPNGEYWIDNEKLKEIMIEKGIAKEIDFCEILDDLNPHDIIVKGANSINYAKSTAGIFIMHEKAGTVGNIVKAVYGKRVKLIVPVGLEKEVSFDLDEISQMMGEDDCDEKTPRMFSVRCELFTEIEAVKVLTENSVEAYHIGTGGIMGAQGAVRLLLDGDKNKVEEICEFIQKLPLTDEFTL